MACRIQNLTHRIVSIRGNSGLMFHLPPDDSLDLLEVEITENDKIIKLVANGILSVQRLEDTDQRSEQ
jgi:hypothetical protein